MGLFFLPHPRLVVFFIARAQRVASAARGAEPLYNLFFRWFLVGWVVALDFDGFNTTSSIIGFPNQFVPNQSWCLANIPILFDVPQERVG